MRKHFFLKNPIRQFCALLLLVTYLGSFGLSVVFPKQETTVEYLSIAQLKTSPIAVPELKEVAFPTLSVGFIIVFLFATSVRTVASIKKYNFDFSADQRNPFYKRSTINAP